jgi:uncharacterized protein
MSLPIVQLNEIPDEGLTIDAPLAADWLRDALAAAGFAPREGDVGRATLRLDRHDRDVSLSGQVEARVSAECVRCLATTPVDIAAEFTLNLRPAAPARRSSAKAAEVELSEDELDNDVYENDRIDVGHWVREQLLLEAPAHPACEPECAVPLPHVGTAPSPNPADAVGDDKIDPRLLPLKKLANKE